MKKISNALDVLDNLIYNKRPIPVILVTLYRHFKKNIFMQISNKFK